MSLTKDSGTMVWETEKRMRREHLTQLFILEDITGQRASKLTWRIRRIWMKLGAVQTRDLQASFAAIANPHSHRSGDRPPPTPPRGKAAMWRVGVSHCESAIPWLQDLGQHFIPPWVLKELLCVSCRVVARIWGKILLLDGGLGVFLALCFTPLSDGSPPLA